MKLTLINFARLILGMQFLLFGCSDVKEDIDSIHKPNYNVDELFKSSTLKKGDEIRPYYHLVFDFYHVGSVNCFPPAENCLAEIVVSNISVQKSANLNEDKSTLYKIFKDLYAQNNVALFFNNDNWSDLFTGLTDFCANENVNGNLKLIMVESANNSKAEIFMLVERNVDINNWTKNDVIGAVQIELE